MSITVSDPSIQTALRILNEALAADPAAIRMMFAHEFSCNGALANHPSIVTKGTDETPYVSFLGLLNGIIEPMTGHRVAAQYGENGLQGFQVCEVTTTISQ